MEHGLWIMGHCLCTGDEARHAATIDSLCLVHRIKGDTTEHYRVTVQREH